MSNTANHVIIVKSAHPVLVGKVGMVVRRYDHKHLGTVCDVNLDGGGLVAGVPEGDMEPARYCLRTGEYTTAAAILALYEEDCEGPGKFEGEEAHVPYLHELTLHGCGGETRCHCDEREEEEGDEDESFDFFCECDSGWETYDIDDDDRAIFPSLAGVATVTLYFSSSGFVSEVSTTKVEPVKACALG